MKLFRILDFRFFVVFFGIISAVLGLYFYGYLNENSFWTNYVFPVKLLWWVGAPFLLTIFAKVLTIKKQNWFASVFWIVVFLSVLAIAALSRIEDSTSAIVLALLIGLATLEAGRIVVSVFRWSKLPSVFVFMVGTIVVHHVLFILACLGLLTKASVFVLFFGLLFRLFQYARRENFFKSRVIQLLNFDLKTSEAFLIFWLISLLTLSAVTMLSPQTHSDGIVERLPFLYQLTETGAFPDHYFKWPLLVPIPMNLLISVGYVALGDIGASAHLFLYVLAFLFLLYEFTKILGIDKKFSFGGIALILSLSPIWLLTTSVYFDISIALFCLAGLYFLIRSRQEWPKSDMILCFVFWGFAASIKMNAAIFVFTSLCFAFLFFKSKLKSFVGNFIPLSLVFLFAWVPWVVRVFLITGNPLYPFFDFVSRPEFVGPNILNKQALSAYAFHGDLLDFFSFPWKLVFSTDSFGEYLPGTFGPTTLMLLPVVMFSFVDALKKKRIDSTLVAILGIGIVTVYLTSLALKASILRYWLGGFVLVVLIGMKFTFDFVSQRDLKSIKSILFLFVPANFAFLVLVGARINYGFPNGVGDYIWFGQVSQQEFINDATLGVPKFVNSKIKKGESVMLTQFFYANHIHAPTIFVADTGSIFGILKSLEKFEGYKNRYTVRYWVVRQPAIIEGMDRRISDLYWRTENVVYASGNLVVYDLLGGKTKLLHRRVFDNSQGVDESSWINSATSVPTNRVTARVPGYIYFESRESARFVSIQIELESSVEHSNLVAQIVGYDERNSEIQRRLVVQGVNRGPTEIALYSDLNKEIKTVKVFLNPWTDRDGQYEIKRAVVNIFE